MKHFDVLVLGGGAAGMMCALTAGQRGRRVLIVERSNRVGKKILMSGGGRCNFTNLYTEPENYLSHNPHFCKSALSRFTPYDFIELVTQHRIPYHEKKLGQLFCDRKSQDIVTLLLSECRQAKVEIRTHCHAFEIRKEEVSEQLKPGRFIIKSNIGTFSADSLVVATGGLSIPTMGATGAAFEIAKQFGLQVKTTCPALVPLKMDPKTLKQFEGLSGVSADTVVRCAGAEFRENILFTHRGLTGPAILQISSYWKPGEILEIDLFPKLEVYSYLKAMQSESPKLELKTLLSRHLTKSLAQQCCQLWFQNGPIQQYSDQELKLIDQALKHWKVKPSGSEGYKKAEVTLNGVDTEELSSKTMESKKVQALYFIGEAMDVTGHLGGFNFQWAWASGYAAGTYV